MEELKKIIKIGLLEIEDDLDWEEVLNPYTEDYETVKDSIFNPEYDEQELITDLDEEFFEDFKSIMLDIVEGSTQYDNWVELIELIVEIEL